MENMKNTANTYIKSTTTVFEINGEKIEVTGNRRFDEQNEPVFDYDLDNELLEEAGRKYRKSIQFNGLDLIEFRKKQGLTQALFAKIIGISRKTLISYEKNYAVPSKHYLRIIRSIMADPVFYSQLVSKLSELPTLKEKSALDSLRLEESPTLYNGYQNVDEVIIHNLLLFFTAKGISQTRLQKAFFYADFLNYKTTGSSLTGFYYRKMDYGPYSEELQKLCEEYINQNKLTHKMDNLIISSEKAKFTTLSKEQLDLIHNIKKYIDNNNAKDVSEESHKHKAWIEPKQFEKISYDYAHELNVDFLK